jgi:hypothetical protein
MCASREIDSLIHSAMACLADERGDFGRTQQGQRNRSDALERSFQITLCETLNQLSRQLNNGWTWCREVRLPTQMLTNEREILVDILGCNPDCGVVPVELKYVTKRIRMDGYLMTPSDMPAFAYDILKDCVKCELLIVDRIRIDDRTSCQRCRGAAPSRAIHGVSIGLTDYADYWLPNSRAGIRGWARNYLAALRAQPIEIRNRIPTYTQNLDRAIYRHRRCHLSFGHVWDGEWHDYLPRDGARDGAACFRYVYLRPRDPAAETHYIHHPNDPAHVPFLCGRTRSAFMNRRAEFFRPE